MDLLFASNNLETGTIKDGIGRRAEAGFRQIEKKSILKHKLEPWYL